MILIRFIIMYIVTMSPAIFMADKFNKNINKTIPLSLICTIILMYIFGLINQLKAGTIFVTIFSIGIIIYTIIKNIKNNTMKELKEKIITNGSKFFTILFFVFLCVSINRELTHWDQFSYWSLAAKDMFSTNSMMISINAAAIYPPVPAILQYFYMNILGGYNQGIEIFVTWILSFSLLLPLFEKSNGKMVSNIAIGIMILCIPAVFSMMIFYESSYPDALLGLILGYILYTNFFEEDNKFKILSISLALVLLTLTKSMGLVISIILLIMFLVYEILKRKSQKEKVFTKKYFKTLVIYVLVIAITYVSWIIYIKINNTNTSINNTESLNIKEIVQSANTTIFGIYEENHDYATSNGKLLEKLYNVTEITTPIQISAMGVVTIFLFIMLIYYYKTPEKIKTKNIIITTFIGLILYTLALQLAYLTQFSTKEMLAHDGMERYIATYLLGIFYLIVVLFLNIIKEKNKNILYIILASIIIMITPLTSVANATITSGIYNIGRMEYCDIGRWRADNIKKQVSESDKVLGICQNENKKLINLMIRYYMYPLNYEAIEKIDNNNKLEDILKEYNYIYIIEKDKYLENTIYKIFNIEIENDTLYKVDNKLMEKIN